MLVVDDSDAIRLLCRVNLELDGHRVLEAATLEEARGLLPQADVVLLDVHVRDTDGFELASKLTGNGSGPCVVLVSSRDGCDYGRLVASCGAAGFIPKGELSGSAIAALLE